MFRQLRLLLIGSMATQISLHASICSETDCVGNRLLICAIAREARSSIDVYVALVLIAVVAACAAGAVNLWPMDSYFAFVCRRETATRDYVP